MRTITIPHNRPVTFSYVGVPQEAPLESRWYSPEGFSSGSAMKIQFDGDVYHTLEGPTGIQSQDAIEVNTGEIVTLDFSVFSGTAGD